MFGLVGLSCGTIHVETLLVLYQVYNSTFLNYFGAFGLVNESSSEFTNVIIQLQIDKQQVSEYVGTLAGVLVAYIQSIQSLTIENSQIKSSYVAGFVASICSNINANMINIRSSTINCSYNILSPSVLAVSGSLIGHVLDNNFLRSNIINIDVRQCIIFNTSIYSQHNVTWSLAGGLIGDSHITPLTIQRIIVNKSDIQASGPVTNVVTASGLVSFFYNQNNINFSNVKVCNSNINASSNTSESTSCSGIFSHVIETSGDSQIQVYLSNSIVTNISILVNGRILSGVILTNNKILQFQASQVSTEGTNTINGVTIQNCASIINMSQSGC
ncbi:Hypothetical_protein [Hexamita inflata]|uniref:Hypothetical_protein n=1 Tax=Hexamita inflata TaxID=28002 RepID=A0ABP1HPD6_9EUKA